MRWKVDIETMSLDTLCVYEQYTNLRRELFMQLHFLYTAVDPLTFRQIYDEMTFARQFRKGLELYPENVDLCRECRRGLELARELVVIGNKLQQMFHKDKYGG